MAEPGWIHWRHSRHREWAGLALDGAVVWLAWQATHLFRLGFERWISARAPEDAWVALGVVVLHLAAIKGSGQSRGRWRYTGFADIRRLALACALAGLVAAVLVSVVLQISKVPRAVLALHPVMALMGLCLVRLVYRIVIDDARARLHRRREAPRRALILGAGEAARRLLAGIQGQGWAVLGLLDDDPAKQGTQMAGVPILGPMDALPDILTRYAPTHLIMALPSRQGEVRRRIVDLASQSGLPLLTVPSAQELREGQTPARIRDVQPEDVLGRDTVELDDSRVRAELADRIVAITGAGGSIGSELCLQVARCRPSAVLLIDHAEFALYRIEQQLRERHPELRILARLQDIKDETGLRSLFQRHRPQIVFHAAAYKHVPLVEEGNALQALRNNAVGTWTTARMAAECGALRFVLISTDKAVNPTNVMGASKRAAERLMAALVPAHPATRFIAVRFGNVLGSSGSVIPRFKEQIARGGPVTVTHPDVIRYFMTIPEACRLVLQASAIGESGQVLVLNMGEPVRIVDLARTLIRLSGQPEQDIPIVFTGLRPGEKLFEELLADQDTTMATPVPQIRLARLNADCSFEQARRWIAECPEAQATETTEAAAHTGSGHIETQRGEPDPLHQAVSTHLRQLVPEFVPTIRSSGKTAA